MRLQGDEDQVFVDASGRRWKTVRAVLILFLISLGTLILWFTPRIFATEPFPAYSNASTNFEAPSPQASDKADVEVLAAEIISSDAPVVGSGPLVRLMQVTTNGSGTKELRDVFSGAVMAKPPAENMKSIEPGRYVFLRYGASEGGRRLMLTFDDGPDPRYTPALLALLMEHSVPSTFFVTGSSTVRYPDIARRIVREGHTIGNHTFTHTNLENVPSFWAEQEINITQRVIRQAAKYEAVYFRPPYVGSSDQAVRNSAKGILEAQWLGYTVMLYDHDTNDWQTTNLADKPPMPPFDGEDYVLLLHDGGGDRSGTLRYVDALITEAKKNGYTFVDPGRLYRQQSPMFTAAVPSVPDKITMTAAQAGLVWPLKVVMVSFSITVIFMLIGIIVFIILACVQVRRDRRRFSPKWRYYHPLVTVIVPAYNESKVLNSCVKSILASDYKRLKVCIVDDGSKDGTWRIAKRLAARYQKVMAVRQRNAGKAAAMSTGLRLTRGAVIIGVDADTLFQSDTIRLMARHFADPFIGAVAGVVKVGNMTNMLTRFQAIEYITSISLERNAHALVNSIMVVPGACGAWRRKAVLEAGGYPTATLAEDCDLTMRIHLLRYKIVQDNQAIAYTEAPADIGSFIKQRFRWTFGNLQVYWKYRNILFSSKYGWLDSFILPNAVITTLTPFLFLPLLALITFQNIVNGMYLHLFVFMLILLVLQFLRAFFGLVLAHEPYRYLFLVPLSRFIYGPLRVYLLYSTVLSAIKGLPVNWNKLKRSGVNHREELLIADTTNSVRAFRTNP